MSGLYGFLKQQAVPVENQQLVVSPRFLQEDGTPALWEIRCLTSLEDETLRQSCLKRVPLPGKAGQFTAEIDVERYLGRLAAACTVFPDLNGEQLQDSYGVMGADSLLKAMLTPGEYAEYLRRVQSLNGFDVTMNELVEQAKN